MSVKTVDCFLISVWICSSAFVSVVVGQAQELDQPAVDRVQLVKIRVRTLEGLDLEKVDSPRRLGRRHVRSSPINVQKVIEDLRGKLSTLPYHNYRLLNTYERNIELHSKSELDLGGGQKLYLKPLSKKGEKVCLWLSWKDEQGAEIIDTRMHLSAGQSMITGTEKLPDSGVILALDVVQ